MNDLYKQPVFSFMHEDSNGDVTAKTFEAESWMNALENFIHFLRGVGFIIDEKAIQIHADYSWDDERTGVHGGDEEPDWVHPDDSSEHLMDSLISLMRKAQGAQY